MKKNLKKLTLARETVRGLDAALAAGGGLPTTGGETEVYSCTGGSGCFSVPKTCETLCLC